VYGKGQRSGIRKGLLVEVRGIPGLKMQTRGTQTCWQIEMWATGQNTKNF